MPRGGRGAPGARARAPGRRGRDRPAPAARRAASRCGRRYGREPGGPHRGRSVVGIGGHGLRGAREPGPGPRPDGRTAAVCAGACALRVAPLANGRPLSGINRLQDTRFGPTFGPRPSGPGGPARGAAGPGGGGTAPGRPVDWWIGPPGHAGLAHPTTSRSEVESPRVAHDRNRRSAECRQVDPVQRPDQERRAGGQLPVRHHRAERRRRRRPRPAAGQARRDLRLPEGPPGHRRLRRHRGHRAAAPPRARAWATSSSRTSASPTRSARSSAPSRTRTSSTSTARSRPRTTSRRSTPS